MLAMGLAKSVWEKKQPDRVFFLSHQKATPIGNLPQSPTTKIEAEALILAVPLAFFFPLTCGFNFKSRAEIKR